MLKKLRHISELIIVKLFFYLLGLLPIRAASNLGGFLGRKLGPIIKANKIAYNNIKMCFPDKAEDEIQTILSGMWDNLGRNITEYPHLRKINRKNVDEYVNIEGAKTLDKIRNSNKTVIFIAGHFANWEMVPKTFWEYGVPAAIVYRKANNPLVNDMLLSIRSGYQTYPIAKGPAGARQLIKAIKNKEYIGMLIDQKQNDGIKVPFFGRNAMTAPAMANLALRYDCMVVPVQLKRNKGFSFTMKLYPEIELSRSDNHDKDILDNMTHINKMFEKWIRENPSDWFWVHNRWPKES